MDQADGNPFLNMSLLIQTALDTGAHAIHPGYGYLSENAEFADRVRAAGLVFIGPSSEAMSTLGDKRASKDYLRQHAPEIPLIPGFSGSSQNIEDLETAAERIGFPVMLKASAGGGGRGMRIVHERSKLREELQRAQSEAQRSFGSSDCILEKYIEAGKHIEVQIMGDRHGKVISLWERECSVQRRHQKVIEETPSPWLSHSRRQDICATAVRLGELLHYEGAGTVEFVVDVKTENYYFLEVNTRLQVEHPITEEVTGLDVVSLQIYVASGGSLKDLSVLESVPQEGHAIECRLCAEDPRRGFLPEHGTVHIWKPAALNSGKGSSRDVRFETAIESGSQISIYFDSMIAKVVVWAPTRALAVEKMIKILAQTVCAGVRTNQLFLQACLLHPAWKDPAYTTSFIADNLEDLLRNPYTEKASRMAELLSLIPCAYLRDGYGSQEPTPKPFSQVRRGFRNQRFDPVNKHYDVVVVQDPSTKNKQLLAMWEMGRASSHGTFLVHLEPIKVKGPSSDSKSERPNAAAVKAVQAYNELSNTIRYGPIQTSPAIEVQITKTQALSRTSSTPPKWTQVELEASISGKRIKAYAAVQSVAEISSSTAPASQKILCHFPALGTWIEYHRYTPLLYAETLREAANEATDSSSGKSVKAPMPCKVLSVLKKSGDHVKAGEVVMVVESMKMEMSISMSVGGKFEALAGKGDAVDEGVVLCRVI